MKRSLPPWLVENEQQRHVREKSRIKRTQQKTKHDLKHEKRILPVRFKVRDAMEITCCIVAIGEFDRRPPKSSGRELGEYECRRQIHTQARLARRIHSSRSASPSSLSCSGNECLPLRLRTNDDSGAWTNQSGDGRPSPSDIYVFLTRTFGT